MDAVLGSLASGIAGGVGFGAVVLLLLLIVKGAIAAAVTHAGSRELARVKGEIDKELDAGRQSFTRELERERVHAAQILEQYKSILAQQAEYERQEATRALEEYKSTVAKDLERDRQEASRTLEQFKAQLTLQAEVLRQVAIKKVEAVLKIAEAARASVEVIHSASGEGPARKAAHQAYWATVREILVLFGGEVLAEMKAFGDELTSALIARDRNDRGAPNWADVVNKGEAARDKLLKALGRELQIVEDKS